MTWREELKPASFRGIPFLVDTHEIAFGRRKHLHEYPYRDIPKAEDLGKRARFITINAYLLGDDYTDRRQRLMDAVENKSTAGTLTLPLYESMQVTADEDCSVMFSNREGGIEYLRLAFTIAGENRYPDQSITSKAKVLEDATNGRTSILQVLRDGFDATARPEYIREDAEATSNSFTDQVRSLLGNFTPSNAGLAAITLATDYLADNVGDLVQDGSQWGGAVQSVILAVRDGFPGIRDAYSLLSGLFTVGSDLPVIVENTSNRTIQRKNRDLQIGFVKRQALMAMAENAASIEFESYDEASTTRNELSDRIDDEILTATLDEDEAITALEKLRATMVSDITSRAASLRRIRYLTRTSPISALALAYDLYDTTDQENDLINRNHVRRPHLIPAGRPIEVLA